MKGLNRKVLLIFAPILILAGVAGFLIPPQMSVTSGAPAYNLFHIVFGSLGLLTLSTRRESYIRGFNISFGLIDLFQAFASFTNLFPKELFRWTTADDILHIIIGFGLIAVGLYGFRRKKSNNP